MEGLGTLRLVVVVTFGLVILNLSNFGYLKKFPTLRNSFQNILIFTFRMEGLGKLRFSPGDFLRFFTFMDFHT